VTQLVYPRSQIIDIDLKDYSSPTRNKALALLDQHGAFVYVTKKKAVTTERRLNRALDAIQKLDLGAELREAVKKAAQAAAAAHRHG
jgi:hypothetical protein